MAFGCIFPTSALGRHVRKPNRSSVVSPSFTLRILGEPWVWMPAKKIGPSSTGANQTGFLSLPGSEKAGQAAQGSDAQDRASAANAGCWRCGCWLHRYPVPTRRKRGEECRHGCSTKKPGTKAGRRGTIESVGFRRPRPKYSRPLGDLRKRGRSAQRLLLTPHCDTSNCSVIASWEKIAIIAIDEVTLI